MKKTCSIVLALFLVLSLAIGVSAQGASAFVFDGAGLLRTQEEEILQTKCQNLGASYGLNIAIVTADTLLGKSPQSYADAYYNQTYGKGTDGILFLLSMEDRDWYISTNGRGMKLLTDGEVQTSVEEILYYLSEGEYYLGFAAWLNRLSYYLDTTEPEPQPSFVLALLIGLAVALIAILVMRGQMNTKRQQQSARHYLVNGSYHIRTQQDFFLYSNVTKTPRPKDSGSRSGGGSGGRSHGGGGGKF